jgi:hypothetical protein
MASFLGNMNRWCIGLSAMLTAGITIILTHAFAQDKIVVSPISNSQMHPRVHVLDYEKNEIVLKIKEEKWAQQSWNNILRNVDYYVEKTEKDPQWLVGRLAMYWKEGERFTQCYVANQNWDYGEGNAPVPTVRLPGMRVWNEYANVPLEDRIPFNETGDMKAVTKKNPGPVTIIPYKKSGHLIRYNNIEILQIAQQAAFVYWITGEEKYARLAAPVFNTWLLGTYFMQPPLDPGKKSGGPGGYEPGGIMGYYDYEQIHDNLCAEAVPIYDFLYSYLKANEHTSMKVIGKPLEKVAGEVFKRFINIGMARGGKNGNWNVNGWDMIMPAILALEHNDAYEDKRGKEFYLSYYTDTTTAYHDALPDIMAAYDKHTGLWGEAPGYGLATVSCVLNMGTSILKSGVNTIANNPMIEKAALGVIPWLDARGNTVLFGDMRGGPANFETFERLLTYYTNTNNKTAARSIATQLQNGIHAGLYNRGNAGWKALCWNVGKLEVGNVMNDYDRAAYSPEHRHITMKNGIDTANGLMFTLYGGYNREKHLSPNGLAMQLYGFGWALAPDAAGYESYWTKDYGYHQTSTGSNTILPGYTAGEIHINAMEPRPKETDFSTKNHISENVSFADVSAGEKRRMVAMIRSGKSSGFYVDIFRSNLNTNDYLYHNLGNSLTISQSNGTALKFESDNDLDSTFNKAYSYFRNVRKSNVSKDLNANWSITSTQPTINMNIWMQGAKNRSVYHLTAPYTTLNSTVTPNGVNMAPDSTYAIIVNQSNNNAWETPFVSVFEPYKGNNKRIKSIQAIATENNFNALQIDTRNGKQNIVMYAIDTTNHNPKKGVNFKGVMGVISSNKQQVESIYLGGGYAISYNGFSIESTDNKIVTASIEQKNKKWFYSADGNVTIKMPTGKKYRLKAGFQIELD